MPDPHQPLIQDLHWITRSDLDEAARFPFPQIADVARDMAFVRVRRVARFWTPAGERKESLLQRAIEDLACSFYGQASPWLCVVAGRTTAPVIESRRGHEVECWFGAVLPQTGLLASLAGTLPGAAFDCASAPDVASLQRFPFAVRLTGAPALQGPRQDALGIDRVDKLCRGLSAQDWFFAVHAVPVARSQVADAIRGLAGEIQRTNEHYNLRQAAVAEPNRFARMKMELLEARQKRLEQGRGLGTWQTTVWLACANQAALQLGRGLLHSAFAGDRAEPEPVRTLICDRGVQRDPRTMVEWLPPMQWLNSSEIAVLASPPRESHPGYEVVEPVRFGVEGGPAVAEDARPMVIGEVSDQGRLTGNAFSMSLDDLAKHTLVVGVTGSGKTNTSFRLLEELADREIPFLVIESAKSEYRGLLNLDRFRNLRVFTVGDERTSPLRLNPFEVPAGIAPQMHIDYLKSLFAAAFVLYPPMPYVLEQSIAEIYRDRGWDLALGFNHRGEDSMRRFPTISDLAAKVEEVIARMGYDERITMDVKAGLLARLDQFRVGGAKAPMLNTRYSVSEDDLFRFPCLVELKQLVDDDEKAFLIGLLLVRLLEYYESGRGKQGEPGRLRHVTVIEEAHRLLRNVSMEQGSEVSANPKGKAIEVFSNMLSEVRAYGEGIVIAEQIPTKLVPDAVKNTNLKIVHRLVAEDDRKLVGATMNLDEAQLRHLSVLRAGQAVAYREGMQTPALVNIPRAEGKMSQSEVGTDAIRQSFWGSSETSRFRYPGCRYCVSAAPGRSCCDRKAEAAGDLTLPFMRLFNALRAQPQAVPAAYGLFAACCAQARVRDLSLNPYCAFVELAETEIERRADLYQWQYDDVEQLIDLACQCASALVNESSALDSVRSRFAAFCEQLFASARRPYQTCELCFRPCHYRYESERSLASPAGARDRERFNDSESEVSLVEITLEAAQQAFPAGDWRVAEAALCYGVHLASRSSLTAAEQSETVSGLGRTFEQTVDEVIADAE